MSEKSAQENPEKALLLGAGTRRDVWAETERLVENYVTTIADRPVVTEMTLPEVRELLARVDFAKPLLPLDALRLAAEGLARTQVNVGHPRYFGLFNPAPTTMGIAADALVAALNPQLAVWKHAPFAVEVENFLIRAFGERFGYSPGEVDGTFASGGSEANHTALLTALTAKFPALAERRIASARRAAGVLRFLGEPSLVSQDGAIDRAWRRIRAHNSGGREIANGRAGASFRNPGRSEARLRSFHGRRNSGNNERRRHRSAAGIG